MDLDLRPFQPDWISPPGDTIADLLEERGLTRTELAERTGFSAKHIDELVHGRGVISAETALRLESVLGSTASFWLKRESTYREKLARRAEEKAMTSEVGWLKELPMAQMRAFGWIPALRSRGAQVVSALRFFAVSSVEAWRARYEAPLAAFRTSKKLKPKPGAVAAWLRRGEIEGAAVRCEPWSPIGFRDVLPKLRALTTEPQPAKFLPVMKELCAKQGVALVVVRAPGGCPASGATKFLSPEKALLILSFRHLADDHLWFSFFHEAGHLLKHGKKALFVEGIGMTSEEENEADQFAREFLIPPDRNGELAKLRSRQQIQAFAAELGIAPGIVVGRLQHDHRLRRTELNDLKVSYSW